MVIVGTECLEGWVILDHLPAISEQAEVFPDGKRVSLAPWRGVFAVEFGFFLKPGVLRLTLVILESPVPNDRTVVRASSTSYPVSCLLAHLTSFTGQDELRAYRAQSLGVRSRFGANFYNAWESRFLNYHVETALLGLRAGNLHQELVPAPVLNVEVVGSGLLVVRPD